jgi:transcriptional regulator NrdR family protein
MSSKNSEFSYECPKCGSDDIDVIEQKDIENEISGRITHFKRTLFCNECEHQWSKKHKVKKAKKDPNDEFFEYEEEFEESTSDDDEDLY